jgi:hypothetical protein
MDEYRIYTDNAINDEDAMAINERPSVESIGRVPTDVRVPPRTAVVIQLRTSASLEGRTVVVVPFMRYSGAAASTICVVKDQCAPIVYANLDDHPLTLRGGTRMAKVYELHEEEEDGAVLLCNSNKATEESCEEGDKEAAIALQIDSVDISNLSPDDGDKLKQLLWKYKSTITASETDIGHLVDYEHHIRVTNETPINGKQWRLPFAHKQIHEEYVAKMVKAGII